MTVNVARRRSRSRPTPAAAESSLAIGEIDQTIFACPACARPLAIGARKCPGCGTRLVLGVELRRASVFTAAGLFIGILFGAGGLFVAITVDRLGQPADPGGPASAAAAANLPGGSNSPEPSATSASSPRPAATASPRPSQATSTVPALSRSALSQALALNGRIRESGDLLTAALAARRFDAPAVSGVLRTLSSDAVVGLGLASHVGAWPGGVTAATALTTLYTSVKATAAEGLAASVRNEKAYRAAATQMVALLAGMEAVDAVVLEAAAEAGVTVPSEPAAP